ncbi:MAG: hypothetical protein IPI95_13225 [Flavobacteriales bacterium]|nr:hypothetical protein [Flavobacteriales bacterium]
MDRAQAHERSPAGHLLGHGDPDNGCSASDTVNVTGIPLPVVQLGPDTGLCASALLYLDATVLGGSYLWNDGSTLPARSVSLKHMVRGSERTWMQCH